MLGSYKQLSRKKAQQIQVFYGYSTLKSINKTDIRAHDFALNLSEKSYI